ncbi:unnamed protein product [Cuscuta campestris]|uniref:F-box associated beta-propeller type 3 domain-containing protein n=1 Tax=Cuscuta campestris TaxID=132261 RepID=A0A484KT64_9ASTE|nr:unnamed protein product [Cuscuta campestris]
MFTRLSCAPLANHFLAYSPVSGAYKIVQLKKDWLDDTPRFAIRTLGGIDKKWRSIDASYLNLPDTYFLVRPLCIGRFAYYLHDPKTKSIIVVFDIEAETHWPIPYPVPRDSMNPTKFLAMRGSLSTPPVLRSCPFHPIAFIKSSLNVAFLTSLSRGSGSAWLAEPSRRDERSAWPGRKTSGALSRAGRRAELWTGQECPSPIPRKFMLRGVIPHQKPPTLWVPGHLAAERVRVDNTVDGQLVVRDGRGFAEWGEVPTSRSMDCGNPAFVKVAFPLKPSFLWEPRRFLQSFIPPPDRMEICLSATEDLASTLMLEVGSVAMRIPELVERMEWYVAEKAKGEEELRRLQEPAADFEGKLAEAEERAWDSEERARVVEQARIAA